MVVGKIHPGSGLGDQLFSYIITRVIALDKGYDFGFVGKEFFKGKDFMDLDWGMGIDLRYHIEQPTGKLVIDNNDPQPRYWWNKEFVFDKPYYDPEINFIEDGTVIDGYGAQDERYFSHRLDEIREWLKVPLLDLPDDLCVINFRGGEFKVFPELYLTKDYWNQAINIMKEKNPKMKFEVHTDDKEAVQGMLGEYGFPIHTGIGENWRSVRSAKNLIISNSAFAIIPALLNENVKEVIAPRYWARRNIKEWSMPSNYYSKFTYI